MARRNAFGFALGNIFTAVFQALLLVVGVWMESNTTTLVLWLLAFLIGYPVSLARQPISRTKTDARACSALVCAQPSMALVSHLLSFALSSCR